MNLPRIRWYSLAGLGTAAAAGATTTASLVGNSGGTSSSGQTSAAGAKAADDDGALIRIDPKFGKVYVKPPKFRDDLTRLPGVDK